MNDIEFSDEIFVDYNKNNMEPKIFKSILREVTFTFPSNIKTSCWVHKDPNKIITINSSGRYVTVRQAIYEFFNGKVTKPTDVLPCRKTSNCINPIHNKKKMYLTPLSENTVEKIIKDCMRGISKNEILITYNITEQQLYDIYIAKSFNNIWNDKNLDYLKFMDTVNFEFNIFENNIDFNKYIIQKDQTSEPISGNDYFKNINIDNITEEETSETESTPTDDSIVFIDRGTVKHNLTHDYMISDNVGNQSVYDDVDNDIIENNDIDENFDNDINENDTDMDDNNLKTNNEKEEDTKIIKNRINKIYAGYCNFVLPEYLKLIKRNELSEEEYDDFEDIIYSMMYKLKIMK